MSSSQTDGEEQNIRRNIVFSTVIKRRWYLRVFEIGMVRLRALFAQMRVGDLLLESGHARFQIFRNNLWGTKLFGILTLINMALHNLAWIGIANRIDFDIKSFFIFELVRI